MAGRHSNVVRGADHVASSNLPSGRFGRMFRELTPAIHAEATLRTLAETMLVDGPGEDNSIVASDGQENLDIPAGYTYLGQFLDHDLTLDTASSLERANDPDALVDFRTPRFDLDSVYGRGPDEQPYLYQSGEKKPSDSAKLLTISDDGDLPRSASQRAIIGDPRNDENRIISQLQGIFIRFHNRTVDVLATQGMAGGALFAAAQRATRWHYQWVVVHDFLKRIAGTAVVNDILAPEEYVASGEEAGKAAKGKLPGLNLRFYHWENEPFMPVEFSGAVYRFGHSMVRPSYHLNEDELKKRDPLRQRNEAEETPFRVPIFDANEPNLNGFRPLQPQAEDWPAGVQPFSFVIDWRFFFDGLGPIEIGKEKFGPQPSYKIDTKLVEPLALLNVFGAVPTNAARPHFHSLAFRNLQRGVSLGLPSGQDVARKMGLPPLTGAQVWRTVSEDEVDAANWSLMQLAGLPSHLGSYVAAKLFTAAENEKGPDGKLLSKEARWQKAKTVLVQLEQATPLWFYILREGEFQQARHTNPEDKSGKSFGARLGSVGARIVAEVFLGLLAGDNQAFLSLDPNWTPAQSPLGLTDKLDMGGFVKFAQEN